MPKSKSELELAKIVLACAKGGLVPPEDYLRLPTSELKRLSGRGDVKAWATLIILGARKENDV